MHQKIYPEVKVRFTYSGKCVDLTLDDLFEQNENYDETKNIILTESMKQLDDSVRVISKNTGNSFTSSIDFDMESYSNYYSGYRYGSVSREDFFSEENSYHSEPIYSTNNTVKCSKCGKFTNRSKTRVLDKELVCMNCLIEPLEVECETYSTVGNFKQTRAPKSMGESLFSYIKKDRVGVESISSLKKLKDFLLELRKG